VSSSSGLHNIYPIYARFNPAYAPLYKRVLLILIFLKHIGLNLKDYSRISISFIISIDSIYCIDLLENGSSAYLHDSQAISKVQTTKLSGMQRP
jgi:hypothetical protein